MGLGEYHRKRDFGVTSEPEGREHPERRGPLTFFVQKHAASHLHFDFRLEMEGVLKSWAVPKGPSLDPTVKRLAVHVEDHPLEYGDFEGIIPKREYGGGTVMLWDRGTWEPLIDPKAAYRKGHLRFRLDGERLRGEWHLVRSRRGGDDGGKEQWLLFKGEDDEARPVAEGEITVEEMVSIATGRTMDEIAHEADTTWHSDRPAAEARETTGKATSKKPPAKKSAAARSKSSARASSKDSADVPSPAGVEGARKGRVPATLVPEMATLVDEVPAGDDWLHEIKYDGYRLVVTVEKGRARMVTRRENDWTDRFPTLAPKFADLPAKSVVLDGELVVVLPNGTTSFNLLQNAIHAARQDDLVFYCFDLMHLDGWDLRGVPLLQRKELLRGLLAGLPGDGQIRFSDHVVGRGELFHAQACRMGLEGIIAKRADSPYVIGKRTRDWLKIKCMRRQEFVIGGYTEPRGSRTGFGALLLGVYQDGELVHVGKVGTGFDDELLRSLHRRMKQLETDESPFANLRRRPRDAHWIRPELVGEVAFTEWTEDDVLRHPTFQGLREDKDPRDVVREEPGAPPPSPSRSRAKKADDPPAEAAAPAKEYRRPLRSREELTKPPSTRATRRRGGGPEAEVAGIRITHPDKVLFPETGLTKVELARYYEQVGEWMLPHVARRPLTLVRCPEGAAGQCFYQKHADDNFPKAVGRVDVRETGGKEDVYTYVDSVPGLVAMVQMGVLELHAWNATNDQLERPDRFILDLDPATDLPWARVVEGAFAVREVLAELGLESFLKTTGGKGLHLVVPVARRHGWEEVKDFSRAVANEVSRRAPGRYITKATLAKRGGKIFIDYLRNGRGATAISAFSVRARGGAPASVPLRWDELSPRLKSADFTPDAVIERLRGMKDDPWPGYAAVRQSITRAMKAAVGMK